MFEPFYSSLTINLLLNWMLNASRLLPLTFSQKFLNRRKFVLLVGFVEATMIESNDSSISFEVESQFPDHNGLRWVMGLAFLLWDL